MMYQSGVQVLEIGFVSSCVDLCDTEHLFTYREHECIPSTHQYTPTLSYRLAQWISSLSPGLILSPVESRSLVY